MTVEGSALGMEREPGLGGAAEPAALLGGHHLERMAVVRARLSLHLAEDNPPAAADDQIELVASGPDVRSQDAIATQAVVESGAALVTVADAPCIQAAATGSGSPRS